MPSLRTLTSALLATALLALAACGGGDGESPTAPVQLDSTRAASATLGPAGGTVVATAADGRRYTLTVEPGALAAATEITATPVVSMGSAPLAAGLKGAVRFGPAGLRFALPATLRIEGANPAASGKRLVGFLRSNDGATMQLQPPVVAGLALEIAVPHFSDAGVADALPQDIASVPAAATGLGVVEVISDRFMRELPADPTLASFIAQFVRLHDTEVVPRLVAAEAGTQPDVHEAAVVAFSTWNTLMLAATSETQPLQQLVAGLDGRVERARARAVAVLQADVEAGVRDCLAPPPVDAQQLVGLFGAIQAQMVAGVYRLDDAALGLDADTVARRLNGCARVAFDPLPLPALEAGRAVSLDARVNLLFADAPNQPGPVAFVFTVSSDDATIANPTGLSDVPGNYTTVVTPRTADAAFKVRACVLASLADGVNRPSVLCGQQTLRGRAPSTSTVLSGRATQVFERSNAPDGVRANFNGHVDLRVQALADGSFSVLTATGLITLEFAGGATCRADDGTPRRITLRRREVHTIEQGRVISAGAAPVLEFSGPTTFVAEVTQNGSCNIETVTQTITDGTEFGTVTMVEITRDGSGLPEKILLSGRSGATQGQLTRE